MRRVTWIVLVVVLCVGALPASARDPECLDAEVLASGPFSGLDPSPWCEAGTCPGLDLAIERPDEFAKVWSRISDDPVPQINFRNQIVIATFMGKRPNTSYTTSIDCVSRNMLVGIGSVGLTVDITDANAGAGCVVSPAVVSPYELVVIDRPTSVWGQRVKVGFAFEHTTSVTNCDPDDPICRICLPDGGDQDVMNNTVPCCP